MAAPQVDSGSGHEGASGPRRSGLGAIFLTLFLDLAGFSIIFPLSPALLEYYLGREGDGGLLAGFIALVQRTSPLAVENPVYTAALFGGILGSIYSLLQFLMSPFWGSLSDRIGRKPVLLVSVAGIAVSYLLWAFSGNFILFIISRFLAGAMGGNISVATAAAADVSTPQTRARAMGIVGMAFGLGFILGPAIGGAASYVNLSEKVPGLNPFSVPAFAAFGLAVLNFLWVAKRFEETLPPERRGKSEERRTINPVRFFQRFDFPGVRAANLIYFFYLLAFGGMEFTLTFLARERFAYEPVDNVWIFVFTGLVMALVQGGLVRRLAPRWGERRVAMVGLVAVIPGFVLLGAAQSLWVFYAGLFFMGFGAGLVQPAITALVSLYTPADRQGGIMGIFRSLGSFSRAVGPLLATVLFWQYGSSVSYYLGAAILILPAAVVLRLPAPPRHVGAG